MTQQPLGAHGNTSHGDVFFLILQDSHEPMSSEELPTEPNTPEPPVPHNILVFARLFPITPAAKRALERSLLIGKKHHRSFIKRRDFYGTETDCFELALDCLPEYP